MFFRDALTAGFPAQIDTTTTHFFRPRFVMSFWKALWYARSLATRSVESSAALMARVLGITSRACAYSAIAICSRDPYTNTRLEQNSFYYLKSRLNIPRLWQSFQGKSIAQFLLHRHQEQRCRIQGCALQHRERRGWNAPSRQAYNRWRRAE